MCDAVESNSGLVRYLRENFNGVRVQCGDFMDWRTGAVLQPDYNESAVQPRQDIRHILRPFPAASGWRSGRRRLNGPRQQEKLLPFTDIREELPRGTFAYTHVPTMIIRLRA